MKTIEEKAKAYDEIIERAKTMLAAGEVMYGKENNASQLITDLIPELRESEDERMMREFNDWLCEEIECRTNDLRDEKDRRTLNMLCYVLTKVKDWLEKQKEQKHYCPSNDDLEDAAREFRGKCLPPIEPISDELIDIIKGEFEGFRNLLKKKGIDYEPQRGYWEGFARLFDSSAREYVKEQKPAWSEEDERKLNDVICIVGKSGLITSYREHYIRFLKSLRPQPKVDSVEYERGYLAGRGSVNHWKPSEEQIGCFERLIAFKNPEPEDIKGCESLLEQLEKLM